jgi:ketosteroid isomerase-like protein
LLSELSGQPYLGHEGVRQWWEENFESWDYEPVELERVVSAGDTGVALLNVRGRGTASGVEIEMKLGMLFRVRGGRFGYMRVYLDRDDALREAGLPRIGRP